MTMSQEAHCQILVFFSGVEDNDEPLGLSSSFGFFPQMQKMSTSWEVPDSLSSPRYFLKRQLIGCITT
jgi:hypothetical protein